MGEKSPENRVAELPWLVIHGGDAVTSAGRLRDSVILVRGSHIEEIGTVQSTQIPDGARVMDARGKLVLPGLIDTHVHGCDSIDVMHARKDGVCRMARGLSRYGVTGFLPTTVAAATTDILAAIHSCYEASTGSGPAGARILGMHLEGPFLNPDRRGAQPLNGIRLPTLEECRMYLDAVPGFIRMMTLAPEMPGSDAVIRLLCSRDVVVSMGHSDADYEEALRAIDLGATHATHLFNQMAPIHHRKPGIIVACLNDPRVTVEMITDGIHLSPAIVRMVLLAKSFTGASLVTDAISALGMPEGEYGLGTHRVRVHAGRCTLANGCPGVETLAGSVHSMDRALFNTMRFSGCSIDEASHMASAVPAHLAGVADRKGVLEPGKDADIVLLQGECVAMTMVEGSPVYVK